MQGATIGRDLKPDVVAELVGYVYAEGLKDREVDVAALLRLVAR